MTKSAFECEDCIGMKQHGCYCAAMGATGPGGITATGRLKREPVLQNLPIRTEEGRRILAALKPDLYEKYASAVYGKYSGWETSAEQCPKCEGYHAEYRVFDIGPDARYRYRCNDCDHGWWAETDQ